MVRANEPRTIAAATCMHANRDERRAVSRTIAPRARSSARALVSHPPARPDAAAADLPPPATEHLLPTLLASRPSLPLQMSKVFAYRTPSSAWSALAGSCTHDGVAPREDEPAALRRFRSALEAEKFRAEAAARGDPRPGRTVRLNCITPGTPFMARPPTTCASTSEETDGGSAVGQGDGDPERPRGEGRRAQDRGAHPVGPGEPVTPTRRTVSTAWTRISSCSRRHARAALRLLRRWSTSAAASAGNPPGGPE